MANLTWLGTGAASGYWCSPSPTGPAGSADDCHRFSRNPGPAGSPPPAVASPVASAIILTRPSPVPRRRSPVRIPRLARRILGPLAVLALWQLVCSAKAFTSVEVASPAAVLDAGRELWAQGVLQSNLLISLQRVVQVLSLGVAAGVLLAVACGLFWVEQIYWTRSSRRPGQCRSWGLCPWSSSGSG